MKYFRVFMVSPKNSPNLFYMMGWQVSTNQLRSPGTLWEVRDPGQNISSLIFQTKDSSTSKKPQRWKHSYSEGAFSAQADGGKSCKGSTDYPRKTHSLRLLDLKFQLSLNHFSNGINHWHNSHSNSKQAFHSSF